MCPVNIQGSTNEEKKENGYSAMVWVLFLIFGHAGFLLPCEGFHGL